MPFTGVRSDKLLQRERSGGYQESLTHLRESLLRSVTSTTISEVVKQSPVVRQPFLILFVVCTF